MTAAETHSAEMDPADWVGRRVVAHDPLSPFSANALVATMELDRPPFAAGDALPPFWHWMHFLQALPRSALGLDGHPGKGAGLTPPVRQARRMWAGGRLEIHVPLVLGQEASKTSEIVAVTPKTGRAGEMVFVTVRHEIVQGRTLAVVEEQDIVYRDDPDPDAPKRQPPQAPDGETLSRTWNCDPVVLFRYSALTFNGHRIHYDRTHAVETEGYPGLVVHGPLLATLLLELAAEEREVTRFAFRATAPVFDGEDFTACLKPEGEDLKLWVRGTDGRQAMEATAS